jgi:hypothetical protein
MKKYLKQLHYKLTGYSNSNHLNFKSHLIVRNVWNQIKVPVVILWFLAEMVFNLRIPASAAFKSMQTVGKDIRYINQYAYMFY